MISDNKKLGWKETSFKVLITTVFFMLIILVSSFIASACISPRVFECKFQQSNYSIRLFSPTISTPNHSNYYYRFIQHFCHNYKHIQLYSIWNIRLIIIVYKLWVRPFGFWSGVCKSIIVQVVYDCIAKEKMIKVI